MCGICGKLNFDRQRPVSVALLRTMMNRIEHRGPDGSGEFVSGPVGLAHRRLSIIDLTTGAQPMSNEDDTVWVVYNGEIYNFRELRRGLEARGHTFKSTSDTEVIVHLYEEMGERCVAQLEGMFAFALWDQRNERLLLARDRVGVKPLYYADTGKSILFASELKSILVDSEVDVRMNPRALDRFFTYYYVPGAETLFDGIRRLLPGHYATVERGRLAVTQYWDLRFGTATRPASFPDAVDRLKDLLSSTIRQHMISDVPVGVLLSGGVDSTGVLSRAAQETTKPIHTFTIGFSGERFEDERAYARLAADRFGTVHHELSITAADFQAFLPQYVWQMEDPVCEPPAVALYYIAKLAHQSSVKVLLSGEGGDEAFGGYQTYRNLLMLERLKSAAGPAKSLLRMGLRAMEGVGWSRIGKYAPLCDLPLSKYYLSRTASPFTFFNRFKRELYQPALVQALGEESSDSTTRRLFAHVTNQTVLSQMLYLDTKTWLPDDLLLKADKMTMAASVELRVPLLDFRTLEFAASLPDDYKVSGWQLKRILKSALSDTLPKEILGRKKSGFPVPYDRWMRGDMREFVFDSLAANEAVPDPYISGAARKRLVRAYERDGRYAKEVFCLLILALWNERFMGSASIAKAA